MATPLQGASFELRDSGGTVLRSGISDAGGIVDLGNISPGIYTLVEVSAPAGFVQSGPYTVEVYASGEITVNGIALADFVAENYPYPNVAFSKTDAVAAALPGAIFALDDQSGTVQYSTSTIDGNVVFYTIPPGTYILTETQAPFGYVTDPAVHTVIVDENGDVTIDGNTSSVFSAVNEEGPAFTFAKEDNSVQSDAPVIDPVRSGLAPVTGTGVPGSTITVTWPDTTTTDVIVDYDNTWTAVPGTALVVDEVVSATQKTPGKLISDPANGTVQPTSDPPVIDPVFENDAAVTGTGVDGSIIAVTWPDASTTNTTVAVDGTWTIAPPAALLFGDEISAVQTTGTMLPSVPAEAVVQAYSPVPVIDTVVEGDTRIGGTGVVGAEVAITWPDTSTSTATVGPYGTWISTPPHNLVEGDPISAIQTVSGKLPSSEATTTVLAISDPPLISTIIDGDTDISGTGIDGSAITVTWPDGSTTGATVEIGGAWTAAAPEALLFGEVVRATQTTPGKLESEPTVSTVTAISPVPVIGYVEFDDTTISGTGVAGSTINITWPNNSTSTASVQGNDSWSATVQGPMVAGDFIYATQITPGMLESPQVQEPVHGNAA